MIFHDHIVDFDGVNYNIKNKNKKMKNSTKFLKQYEIEIINKLRTEHINLNHYKKKRFKDTDGKCQYCGVKETVNHFLLDCPGSNIENHNTYDINYNIQRRKLKSELKKISIFFKYEQNFNCENLLFPYVWLVDPNKKDPNYQEIKNRNQYRITNVLKAVVKFVKNTKRFKKEKYKI